MPSSILEGLYWGVRIGTLFGSAIVVLTAFGSVAARIIKAVWG